MNRVDHLGIYRDPLPGEATQLNGLVFIQNALFIAGARPDVKAAYPNYPDSDAAGWGTQLLSNELPGNNGRGLGNGNYVLHAIAFDHSDPVHNYTELGRKYISVDNADSHAPFGTIDYPHEGETVSGTAYANFGWALTPQPNIIPIDGSTIWVSIDGQAAHPVYNDTNRTDIASLFPGLQNSHGAGGHYVFNPAQFGPGLHTISWNVTDNVGNMAGLGSRYFNVAGATPSYVFGSGTTASGGGASFFVYNDNIAKTFGPFYCSGGADCTTAACYVAGSNGGVTVTPVNKTQGSHSISIQAALTASPGVNTRTVGCCVAGPNGSLCGAGGLSVYDGTPQINSYQQYPPASDGSFYVTLYGTNFGPAPGSVAVCVHAATSCNGAPDVSISFAAGQTSGCPSCYWSGSQVNVLLTPSPTASGTYDLQLTSGGGNPGLGFQFAPGNPAGQSAQSNRVPAQVKPRPIIKLSSLSWSYTSGGSQYVMFKQSSDWTRDRLADEGATQVSNPVWVDANGNGTPTTSDPVAYLQGTTPSLYNISFTADQTITSSVIVRVATDQASLAFPDFVVQFSGGTATYAGPLASQNALPTTVSNINATLTWSASFDGGTTWWLFPTTSKQRIFVTAGPPAGFPGVVTQGQTSEAAAHITAARLNKVTTDFSGLNAATDIATKARNNVAGLFRFVFANNLAESNVTNPWSALDSPGPGWDCISLSEIAFVQILQAGVDAGLWFAYSTTDADATTVESSTIQGQDVNLDFFPGGGINPNLFEAFLTVNAGGVPTEAHMLAPLLGPLSVATDPIANNQYVSGLSNLQRLAFAVIYNEHKIDASEQWWYNNATRMKVQGPVPFPIPIQ